MVSLTEDNLLAHVGCAVCGADDAFVRWDTPLGEPAAEPHLESWFCCTNTQYGRFGRIVECRSCGLLYRDPQERDLLSGYTAAIDPVYVRESPARDDTFERSLRQLAAFAQPPGRLLDVGCSTGRSVRVATRAGWRAVGLEPCRWAVREARRAGLPVVEGTLEQHPFRPGEFDVVTLWDVIEHVPDPRGVLAAVHSLLRPGGVIGLTTMDLGSLVAGALGWRWPHYMRMHLWYFRFEHVARLLREVGFVDPCRQRHVRVLSAAYLASRLEFADDSLARAGHGLVRASGLTKVKIPICLGDLMAVYARKP